MKQGQKQGPAVENKLLRRVALVTPTAPAPASLRVPESQSTAVPVAFAFHSQRQAACNPSATPKPHVLHRASSHANARYPRRNSQVPA
ncbi:hypothetical protein PAL_GLEAN10014546 [Pteropus alecto]|uniref:Uncharacterized protein n=1 Tax=Pteropus alecto TaxID=9402 RepID=L5KKS8_PTEAL|nr:hypothetical protein PAL_GLEAN10014546 [Pteropus alecto]